MNQIYRALHRLAGRRPVRTVAVRPVDPEATLPALGGGAYRPLEAQGLDCPALVEQDGTWWLFCNRYAEGDSDSVAAFPVENGQTGEMRTVLRQEEPFGGQAPEADGIAARESAGAEFSFGGQRIRPVCSGENLQFYVRRPDGEVPLCAVGPRTLEICGMESGRILRITGYCRGGGLEAVAVEYLAAAGK